jgi:hypothetical protein
MRAARAAKFDAIEPVLKVHSRQRHAPPPHLTDAEKVEWNKIIDSVPSDWFSAYNLATLEHYCHHITAEREISERILKVVSKKNYDYNEYARLLRHQMAQTRMVQKMLTSMRLTQQSGTAAPSQYKNKAATSPSVTAFADKTKTNGVEAQED